jgi:putative MATE family efflux protein
MFDVQSDFSQGSVKKTIFKLSIPLVFAQIINALYNIVDRIYIGHIRDIGTTALTGVGVAAPLIMIASAFALLWGLGGMPLAAIERGKKNDKQAEIIMCNSFAMLILTGITVGIILFLIKDNVLFLVGASEETFPFANDYLTICLFGLLFSMVSLGMNGFINAQGFPKIGMLTVVIGALLNIALDPVFIFALDMGVKGAAISTVISQIVSCVWVLRFLTAKKASLRLNPSSFKLNIRLIGRIAGLGISELVMKITTQVVFIAMNASLLLYGGDIFVTAGTVINSIKDIAIYPISGFSNGAQPFLSYNYGAKRYDRVCSGIRFITVVCISASIIIEILLMAFPQVFIGIFSSDPELSKVAVPLLRIFFALYAFLSFQMAGQYAFVGLGKSKQAVFFSFFRKVFILLPILLILPRFIGVEGIFWAEPISDAVGGLACYITMLITVYMPIKRDAEKMGQFIA